MEMKDRSGKRVASTSTGTLMRVRRAHVTLIGANLDAGLAESIRAQATMEGMTGYITKTDKGMDAVFEGSHEDIDVMLDWLRERGHKAGVRALDIAWEPPKALSDFEIR